MRIYTYLLLLLAVNGSAQSLSGYLYDPRGLPIADAYLMHIASGAHTHSDQAGYFELEKLNQGDTITISHINFVKETLLYDSDNAVIKLFLEPSAFKLDEVVIQGKPNALQLISDIDVNVNPVTSSQEILRRVPGLFIGQHAGGGKAEQIFLRGFDIDHGTDIGITVDGMPVNMVSHAHGQGYADLHFLIPETIEGIAFDKGSY